MKVTQRSLIIVAAIIWYVGGMILLLKGGTLIKQAYVIDADSTWPVVAAILGIGAGLFKGRTLFSRTCKKNIERIETIANPIVWQCFRPRMIVFLAIMVSGGAWLSSISAGNYTLLCLIGALDLSISLALLTSGLVFWKR